MDSEPKDPGKKPIPFPDKANRLARQDAREMKELDDLLESANFKNRNPHGLKVVVNNASSVLDKAGVKRASTEEDVLEGIRGTFRSSALSENESAILEGKLIGNKSNAQIAEELGISEFEVAKSEKEALKKMRSTPRKHEDKE